MGEIRPEGNERENDRLGKVLAGATGLTVTRGPASGPTVTSEDVRAILADFP